MDFFDNIKLMKKKIVGIIVLLITYSLAFLIGYFSYVFLEPYMHFLLAIFIADVIATIFVWLIGIIFKTASIYDPYWSVQTLLIYIPLMFKFNNFSFGSILLLIIISIYTIRLTGNFLIGFNDLSYIDWRYKKIKDTTGKFYQFVSLIGIHLVPTIVVYAASVPSFMYLEHGADFNPIQIIGLIVMLIGILLELIADTNMKQFQKIRTSRKEIIRVGLWKNSRHPNYLGEILFWYGLSFVFIFTFINEWYFIFGAVLNTLLFLFISIPLADNHLKTYKEGYDEYVLETHSLLPLPRFNVKKEKEI